MICKSMHILLLKSSHRVLYHSEQRNEDDLLVISMYCFLLDLVCYTTYLSPFPIFQPCKYTRRETRPLQSGSPSIRDSTHVALLPLNFIHLVAVFDQIRDRQI